MIETGLPLGILPLGTANDLARTLGVPEDLDAAADLILAGRTRRIDCGEVNGRPFFNVASIGISADLAKALTRDLKRRFGRLGYALAAAQVMWRARPFRATIEGAQETARVLTCQVAVRRTGAACGSVRGRQWGPPVGRARPNDRNRRRRCIIYSLSENANRPLGAVYS